MISLCILTKNSEKMIARCIDSAKEILDEIIVVDTGSSDKTKEIVRGLGAQVYDYKWNDNFSDARNFLISKAKEDWILILDCDETISSQDYGKIKELVKSDRYLGYYLIQRNYVRGIGHFGWISCSGDRYEESKIANGYVPRKIVRLFRNDSRISFKGVIHDSVIQSIEKIGLGLIGDTDIAIHHYGLLERGAERNRWYIDVEKRNLRNDFYQEYQIAIQLHSIGEIKEASEHLLKSIELNPDFFLSYLELAIIAIKSGKIREAKPLLLHSLKLKEHEETWNNLGIVEVYEGNFNESIECFKRAIEMNDKNAGFHFNLAQALKQIGREKEAQEEFEKAVYLNKDYEEKRGEFEK
jgi:glycosyltransferase involved in cell wall biosynthesis